jgi:hypothetical protein
MVTAPLAVNEEVESVRLIAAAPDVPVEKSMVEHCAAYPVGMVTVIFELMVTESAAPGTDNPPQVAVLFQAPETEAILAAAWAGMAGRAASPSNTIMMTATNFAVD